MEPEERSEIREMIHGALEGYVHDVMQQNTMTNLSLSKIDKHLEKLNGKIVEHEKIINENLPHGIIHCSQTKNIEGIKRYIENKRFLKSEKRIQFENILKILGIMIALGMLILGYLNLNHKSNQVIDKVDTTNYKVDNLGAPVLVNPRGEIINVEGVKIKMFKVNDTTKKDSVK